MVMNIYVIIHMAALKLCSCRLRCGTCICMAHLCMAHLLPTVAIVIAS